MLFLYDLEVNNWDRQMPNIVNRCGKSLEMYFSEYTSTDPRKKDELFSVSIVLCKITKVFLQS